MSMANLKSKKIDVLTLVLSTSMPLMSGCAMYDQALAQSLSQHHQQPISTDQQTITPNAYGLGINADQYGRPQTYRTQDGQQLSPIFQGSVKPNAYGPGVGMDQFGRPVHSSSP